MVPVTYLLGTPDFMGYLVHPPHPLARRVTSTIVYSLAGIFVEAATVAQSCRLDGDHIFHPGGHEFFWVDRYTFNPPVTLTNFPAKYGPWSATGVTLHATGLPGLQDGTVAATLVNV